MPTYIYRREDGSTFEIQQRITEPALTNCPETGQAVSRVISGSAGLIFKGDGFYLTDYARKKNVPPAAQNGEGKTVKKSDDAAGKVETKAAGEKASESKTETKAAA